MARKPAAKAAPETGGVRRHRYMTEREVAALAPGDRVWLKRQGEVTGPFVVVHPRGRGGARTPEHIILRGVGGSPFEEYADPYNMFVPEGALMASTDNTTPETRAADLFDDSLFCLGVGPHFTCQEAETIAAWLRSLGREDAADLLIAGHAIEDDDEDDIHRLEEFDARAAEDWPSWVKLVKEPQP